MTQYIKYAQAFFVFKMLYGFAVDA